MTEDDYEEPEHIRKINNVIAAPEPFTSVCQPEEEAWTEEYFAKQDCGEVLGTPPSYQYVLLSYEFDPIENVKVVGTFCQLGYAKLFQTWMQKLDPRYHYDIKKTIQNPHKPEQLRK